MRSFFALAAAATANATIAYEVDSAFIEFIAKHGKAYNSIEEFNLRHDNFKFIDSEIKRFNSMNLSSVHAHNEFSDWSREEYRRMLGLRNMPAPETHGEVMEESGVPNAVDWVAAGYVNPVQNQGSCGSCWAFSATAATESAYAIKHGKTSLYKLSEQQLTSCSSSYGNGGCNGGWYYYAWDYTKTYAQESESNYPYTSGSFGVTGSCKYNASYGLVKTAATDYTKVSGTTSAMQTAVALKPNSVAIQADTTYFQTYSSGILTSSACGTNIDHAVVVTGYNVSSTGTGYWIVRNSWGTGWGNKGYVWIGQASGAGICGIN